MSERISRPPQLDQLKVIPIAERRAHVHHNPIALKKVNREEMEKRRIAREKANSKHWERPVFLIGILAGLFIIAVLVKNFPEAMERIYTIKFSDFSTDNIIGTLWEAIMFFR